MCEGPLFKYARHTPRRLGTAAHHPPATFRDIACQRLRPTPSQRLKPTQIGRSLPDNNGRSWATKQKSIKPHQLQASALDLSDVRSRITAMRERFKRRLQLA